MNIRIYDAKCMLKSVGCVITDSNIYANLQKYDDPSMIDFDLSKPKLWKPLFDKGFLLRNPQYQNITTIQPDNGQLKYYDEDEQYDDLEKVIYKYVTSNFEKLRLGINDDRQKKRTTNWNIEVGNQLQETLDNCEIFMQQARKGATNSSLRGKQQNQQVNINMEQVNDHIQNTVNQYSKGMTPWGFPLNMPFTSLEDIWQAVKATRIHDVDDRTAQFSLSVKVWGYPCNVLSVWIYICVLTGNQIIG